MLLADLIEKRKTSSSMMNDEVCWYVCTTYNTQVIRVCVVTTTHTMLITIGISVCPRSL